MTTRPTRQLTAQLTGRPRATRVHLASGLTALALLGAGLVATPSAVADDQPTPAAPSASGCPTPGGPAAAEGSTPSADPSGCATDGGQDQPGVQDSPSTPAPSARARARSPQPSARAQAAPATVVNGVTCTSANDANHTPSTSNATAGSFFNLPYGSYAQRNNLRQRVLNAINAVPCGQYIQIAVYSMNDKSVVDALVNAYRRGVGVKVIVNSHMVRGPEKSSQFLRLYHYLGQSTVKQSWARTCSGSCRGTGGNHHYKMYLFGQVHATRYVAMMGSHNSTAKAVNGQWNHMDVTYALDTYQAYQRIFGELAADRAQRSPYRDVSTTGVETYFFPRPGTSASNDPMMVDTAGIRCTGVPSGYGRGGRSLVRIGMYAWYDSRGVWLAKRVRALWNAGCDVAIEYAIMGNTVKKILYSPAGRGRIPMRQVTTTGKGGEIANYLHDKYVTFSGRQYSYDNVEWVATGTTNWSDLGFASDDFTQVWRNRGRSALYRSNFYGVWRGPKAHVPSPTSRLPSRVGTGDVRFGQGKYRNLETN